MKRAKERVADRDGLLASATIDITATLQSVRRLPNMNGNAAVLGFCVGGPLAVIAVTQLGCVAGASFHGSNFETQLENLAATSQPLELHWGDADFALSPELLRQVQAAAAKNPNCNITIYPGVEHGYTTPSSPAFNAAAAQTSWTRTLEMLRLYHGEGSL
jgi:carboxymethylenebutenolidase